MISQDFLNYVENAIENLENYYEDLDQTKTEKILSYNAKLNEEVWELNSEVLAFLWRQRKEKLKNYNTDNLKWEFCDVLLTALILAKSMNIDINEAIQFKMDKINKRWWI